MNCEISMRGVFDPKNMSKAIEAYRSYEGEGEFFLEKRKEGGLFYRIEKLGRATFTESDSGFEIDSRAARERTITYLKEAYGAERITEIFKREVDEEKQALFAANSLPLDRRNLQILCLGLAYYAGEGEAPPFENSREDPFFGERPEVPLYGGAPSCGKGVAGLMERLYIIQELAAIEEPKQEQVVEILSSKLADREPPEGTPIAIGKRSYRYERNFTNNGAFISLLVDRDDPKRAIITCRGTAGGKRATGFYYSNLNNLQREPGVFALAGNWSDIAEELERKKIEQVDIYGKSQGGAIALYMAPLIEKYCKASLCNIYTYASIGISEEALEIFIDLFNRKKEPMSIVCYYNIGDIEEGDHDTVPTCCGSHVEVNTEYVTTKYYGLSKEEYNTGEAREGPSGLLSIHYFFASFDKPHNRHTTDLAGYKVTEMQAAKPDPLLDGIRGWFANLLEAALPPQCKPPTYRHFFLSLQNCDEAEELSPSPL